MSSLTVYDHLALHPMVADLPAGWLRRLAAYGTFVAWPASTRLLRVGGPVDRLWLLCSGAVVLDLHVGDLGDVPIETLAVGGVVGWSCLIPPYRSTVGAGVTEECRAIEIGAAPLRELIAEDPAFGLEFTTRMLDVAAQRMRAAQRRLTDFGCRVAGGQLE